MNAERRRRDHRLAAVPVSHLSTTAVLFWVFGATGEKDLFDAALAVPLMAAMVLTGPPVFTLVDRLCRAAALEHRRHARHVFTATIRGVITVSGAVTAVGVASSPWLASHLFPAVSDTARLAGLIRISLVTQFSFGLSMVALSGVADGERRFLSWIAPLSQPAGVAIALLGFGARVEHAAWGALAGAGVASALVVWRAERSGFGFDWRTPWRHESIPTFVDAAVARLRSSGLYAIESLLPAIGGQFAGAGAIAVLTGGRFMMVAIVGLLALPDASAGPPPEAPHETSKLHRAAVAAETSRTIPIATFALALLVGLSSPLVATVFGWGAFDEAAVATTALLVVVMSIAVPFLSLAQVVPRSGDVRGGAVAMSGALVVVSLASIPAAIVLARSVGSSGVALVWTLVGVLAGTILGASWFGRGPRSEVRHLARWSLGSGIAATTSCAIALGCSWLGSTLGVPGPLTLVVGVAAATVTWLVTLTRSGIDPDIRLLRTRRDRR